MLFTEKDVPSVEDGKSFVLYRVGFVFCCVHCWMENLTWVFVEILKLSSRMSLRACIRRRIRTYLPSPLAPPCPSRGPSRRNAPCVIR